MRRPHDDAALELMMIKALAGLALACALAACGTTAGSTGGAGGSPLGLPTSAATATPSAVTSATPASPPRPTASTAASASPAACATTATGTLMGEQALLTDVRVGTHDGYDRVVFEFVSRGSPARDAATFEIAKATAPYVEDPSGRPIMIAGTTVLGITFRGATTQTLDSRSSYNGSRAFAPRFPILTELKSRGDFEAVNSWLAGTSGASCLKAQVLTNPTRLVVDLSTR